jgi:hypothetical protein
MSQTFAQTMNFWAGVKQQLAECERIGDRETRVKKYTELFDFLLENQETVRLDASALTVKDVIQGKLLNFKTNAPGLLDADKYLVLLFPKKVAQPKTEKPVVTPVVTPTVVTPVMVTPEVVTIEKKVVEFVTPNLVFEDYKESKFSALQHTGDTLLDQVLKSVAEKYPDANVETVTSLLDKTVDQVKVDATYPNGPFLVKVSDNFYELYEKVTEEKKSVGYLYTSTKIEPFVTKLGRYGKVF